MEKKWAGSLRIGVCALNPNDRERCVFRAATELLADEKFTQLFWLWSGDKLFQMSGEHKLTLNLHSLVVNDVVGLQVKFENFTLHSFFIRNSL